MTTTSVPVVPIRNKNAEEIREASARFGLSLSPAEWSGLIAKVGRDLTLPEAFLLDVALSEHCSYKSSKPLLKKYLPTDASHVVLGPVEDAGVVSLGSWKGEEWALVVAHESHNHPSQVLPIEGAATGIGGIVRDVYCMGCDVAGVLDPLRFGRPDGPEAARTRALVRGVVQGISEYGNALGVPNLGGDLVFHEGFEDNCLVNVVAFGVMKRAALIRSRVPEAARHEPYVLILVGKPTDATGLGGASFASQVLDEDDAQENRGAVQVHDPFLKRMLVAAMRELWDLVERDGLAVGCKDLGAGGLGGASSELAIAGGMGLEIDLERVPHGVADPEPHQLLCAETQERFVWGVPETRAEEICAIFNEKYELGGVYPNARAQVIGRFVHEPVFRCRWKGETVVDLSNAVLSESPIAERPRAPRSAPPAVADPAPVRDWPHWVESQLHAWNAVSRAPIYRTYDPEVRGEAFLRPGEADAGVCRPVADAPWGIAIAVDGNPEYGALDAYWGGALAVLESVRNVVATGATPLAITDCLNFGNPEDPVCLGDLERALQGMGDACRAVGSPGHPEEPLPIVSGNVSLYNQSSRGKAIAPSPIVACFGKLEDYGSAVTPRLRVPGDVLLMVGRRAREWGRPDPSRVGGRVPAQPIETQAREIHEVLAWIHAAEVTAAHDIADGGLLRTAFEMAVSEDGPYGLGVALAWTEAVSANLPAHEFLCSESPGFLLEVTAQAAPRIIQAFAGAGGFAAEVGRVVDAPVLGLRAPGDERFEIRLETLHARWRDRLLELLDDARDLEEGSAR